MTAGAKWVGIVTRVVTLELGPRILFFLFLRRYERPYQSGTGLINLTRQSFLSLTHSEPICCGNSFFFRYGRKLSVMTCTHMNSWRCSIRKGRATALCVLCNSVSCSTMVFRANSLSRITCSSRTRTWSRCRMGLETQLCTLLEVWGDWELGCWHLTRRLCTPRIGDSKYRWPWIMTKSWGLDFVTHCPTPRKTWPES